MGDLDDIRSFHHLLVIEPFSEMWSFNVKWGAKQQGKSSLQHDFDGYVAIKI